MTESYFCTYEYLDVNSPFMGFQDPLDDWIEHALDDFGYRCLDPQISSGDDGRIIFDQRYPVCSQNVAPFNISAKANTTYHLGQEKINAASSSSNEDIFSCVNLDSFRSEVKDSPPKTPTARSYNVQRGPERSAESKRDYTTIPKVMFSMMKKQLKDSCPINLRYYWKLCPYGVNPRTLMDFEVPFMFAEIADKYSPGTLAKFRDFLDHIKPRLKQKAEIDYENNPGRLDKFMHYLTRVYHAYHHGINSDDRMMILYGSACKMPKAMERLTVLREKFYKLF